MAARKQTGKTGGLQAGASVTLGIESLNSEGQGVARHEGLTVFVTGAIPGDRVDAVVERRQPQYAVARLQRVLSSSPDRIEPVCAVAEACGGCSLQPMRYDAQLRVKREQVIAALKRIGGFDAAIIDALVRPVAGMADPEHYRSKVQFPVGGSAEAPRIGFYAARSHAVVDHSECRIEHPAADAVRSVLREHCRTFHVVPYDETSHQGLFRHLAVRVGFATGQVMVILVVNGEAFPGIDRLVPALQKALASFRTDGGTPFVLQSLYLSHNTRRTNLVLGDRLTLLHGTPQIEEHLLGLRYRISPLAFFQVNPVQTEVLYQTAVDFAGLTGHETVFDLYCGTGSISLALARAARLVIGVEEIAPAIDDARENARLNGLETRTRFEVGRAEDVLPVLIRDEGVRADVAVVDPPRKGCDPRLLEAILTIAPPRFVYVSCNPATLARDLAILARGGAYRLAAVQPVDLFPQTAHVETVVLMSRCEAGKA